MNIFESKIAIIGLGYVGLPLAVEFGKKRKTLGYDINHSRIKELKEGNDVTLEVSKSEINNSTYLKFSSKVNDLKECNIYIITVPTPIDHVNRPNLEPLKRASETVAKVISKGDLIIFESTVFPGCTEEVCVPLIESNSGFTFNKDFFCGYSPERINPGDKTNTLTKIKKITSGSNPEISLMVDSLYKQIIEAGTYMASSIKVAESAKVIENTQRDLNIALINELSIIFNRLDIDTIEVLDAASSKWNFLPFKPGLVGGHCIGVDPYYLTYKAEQIGYNPEVILAGRRINDNMAQLATKKVIQEMTKNKIDISTCKVGILGFTFKENCPDIRNTKIIDIINELKQWNIEVVVSDPWANANDVKSLYDIELQEINKNNKVDSLVVAVGHKEYREIDIDELREYCSGDSPVLADLKSLYDKEKLIEKGFTVFRL